MQYCACLLKRAKRQPTRNGLSATAVWLCPYRPSQRLANAPRCAHNQWHCGTSYHQACMHASTSALPLLELYTQCVQYCAGAGGLSPHRFDSPFDSLSHPLLARSSLHPIVCVALSLFAALCRITSSVRLDGWEREALRAESHVRFRSGRASGRSLCLELEGDVRRGGVRRIWRRRVRRSSGWRRGLRDGRHRRAAARDERHTGAHARVGRLHQSRGVHRRMWRTVQAGVRWRGTEGARL